MKIQICVSVATQNQHNLPSLIEKAESRGADLIEVRLDCLKSIEGIEKIFEHTSVPLIATNRRHEQGGCRVQDEKVRIRDLVKAVEYGFQYADIELNTNGLGDIIYKLRNLGVKSIVSFHGFERTPSVPEMEKIVEAQMEAGAEVCKLVTKANNIEDNVPCLLLVSKMCKVTKIVCFAMGEMGLTSRVLSPVFGGYFTYASLRRGLETAPGQITISELKKLYKTLGVEA